MGQESPGPLHVGAVLVTEALEHHLLLVVYHPVERGHDGDGEQKTERVRGHQTHAECEDAEHEVHRVTDPAERSAGDQLVVILQL